MGKVEAKFWQQYNNAEANPVGSLTQSVCEEQPEILKFPPEVVASFMRGCSSVYNAVTDIDPSIIFLPERGAAPVGWTLETFAQENNKQYFHAPLPLGTHADIITYDIKGIPTIEKRSVVRTYVDNLNRQKGILKTPLLIDEVQSGGTITAAAHELTSILQITDQAGPLNIIAVQSSSNGWLAQPKAKGYRSLFIERKFHTSGKLIELPFFTIDRQEFLNQLLYPSDAPATSRASMQMVLYNTEAAHLIKTLTLGYLHPAAFRSALEAIQTGNYRRLDENEGRICKDIKRLYPTELQRTHTNKKSALTNWLFGYSAAVNLNQP